MTLSVQRWLTLAGAALPLLLALLAPTNAKAACGDYLMNGQDGASHRPEPRPATPDAPCQGPGCSQHQTPLTPPPAPPTVPLANDWLHTTAAVQSPPVPPSGWLHSDAASVLIDAPVDIFHPPR